MDEGYYQTKCTTTTVTRVPVTTTVTQDQTQTTQVSGDNCQYKWEGKGDNMR